MYPYINLEKTGKQIQKYMNQVAIVFKIFRLI